MKRFQILTPTEEQKSYARENIKSSSYYQRNDTRTASKKEQYYSFLAEVVIADAFFNERPSLSKTADKGYDVDYHGTKIDVKVCSRHVLPAPNHEVHVLEPQVNNSSDDVYYLFLLWSPELEIFYVAGLMSKKGFLNTSKLYQKGEMLHNGYVIDSDQYITEIHHLACARIP